MTRESRIIKGFTMLELVLSIVIIGLLTALAAPRLSDIKSTVDARGFADSLQAAIHYAQKVSMSSECDTLVSVDQTGYRISQWPVCRPNDHLGATSAVSHPSFPGPLQDSTPSGVSLTGQLSFYYPASGTPHDPSSETELTASANITVDDHQITVEAVTGFVHAP